jgi:hypothetical protein
VFNTYSGVLSSSWTPAELATYVRHTEELRVERSSDGWTLNLDWLRQHGVEPPQKLVVHVRYLPRLVSLGS